VRSLSTGIERSAGLLLFDFKILPATSNSPRANFSGSLLEAHYPEEQGY
jgi:hypothetical protein